MKKSIFIALASLFCTSAVSAADTKSVTCFNGEGSVEVQLKFVDSQPTEIAWKQDRSSPARLHKIVNHKMGPQLWEGMPAKETVVWPIGNYVGRLNSDTVILTIARPASAGGGGYSYEGILTAVHTVGAALTWGVYCNQD